jgi:hypothetical protein
VGVRFPWGDVLASRCGSLAAPLDIASGGRRPPAPSSRLFRVPSPQSRPFARSGEGRVDEAIRCRQLRPIPVRRTSRPTPFQRRGCELALGLLGPSSSLHRTASTSDVPLSSGGTPESDSISARCAARDALAFRLARPEVSPPDRRIPYCRAREGPSAVDPRTPSVVSRTCKPKPTGRAHENLVGT